MPGEVSMEPSPFTSPVSSFPVSLWGLFLWALAAVLLPVVHVGAAVLAVHVGAELAVHVGAVLAVYVGAAPMPVARCQ
jgi:hypothetical protein